MKSKAGKSVAQSLAVGEQWFVKLPGADKVAAVRVDELTERTVAFDLVADTGNTYTGPCGRYVRREVKFIERIPT
jgi:hypothetical protein